MIGNTIESVVHRCVKPSFTASFNELSSLASAQFMKLLHYIMQGLFYVECITCMYVLGSHTAVAR